MLREAWPLDLQPLNTGTIGGHEECGDKSHMLSAKEWEAGVWSFSSLVMKGTAGQGGKVRGQSFWIRKPFGTKVGETDWDKEIINAASMDRVTEKTFNTF